MLLAALESCPPWTLWSAARSIHVLWGEIPGKPQGLPRTSQRLKNQVRFFSNHPAQAMGQT